MKTLTSSDGTYSIFRTWIAEPIDNTLISPAGLRLDRYRRNPAVLMNFDHNQIIGRCTSLSVQLDYLEARVAWSPDEMARRIARAVKNGLVWQLQPSCRIISQYTTTIRGEKYTVVSESELLSLSVIVT